MKDRFSIFLIILFVSSILIYVFAEDAGVRKSSRNISGLEFVSKDSVRFVSKVIIDRAKAIDKLFHMVYNAQLEGANGALGDAFLYAVSGDTELLQLYTKEFKLTEIGNGTWVDDRAWACLAEMCWWHFTGRKNKSLVEDAKDRFLEAKKEVRHSSHEGFWSWYNYTPNMKGNFRIFTNSNMNQMVTVA